MIIPSILSALASPVSLSKSAAMGGKVSIPSRNDRASRLVGIDGYCSAVPKPAPQQRRTSSRLPRSVERYSQRASVGGGSQYAAADRESVSPTTTPDKSSRHKHRRARSVPQHSRRSELETYKESRGGSMPRTSSDALVLRSSSRSSRRLSQQPSLPRMPSLRKEYETRRTSAQQPFMPQLPSSWRWPEDYTSTPRAWSEMLVKSNSRSSSGRRHSRLSLHSSRRSDVDLDYSERRHTPRTSSDTLLAKSSSRSSSSGRRFSQPTLPSLLPRMSTEDYPIERYHSPRTNSDSLLVKSNSPSSPLVGRGRYSQPSLPSMMSERSSLIGSISRRRKSLNREKNGGNDEGYPCYYLPEGNPHPTPTVRRRSLVTQPGLPTRTPRNHEQWSNGMHLTVGSEISTTSSGSSGKRSSPSPARAATPTCQDYSYLGAFKPGSLRVMNGSVSPCPSDGTYVAADHDQQTPAGIAITADLGSGFLSSSRRPPSCPSTPSTVVRSPTTSMMSPTSSMTSMTSPTSPTASTMSSNSKYPGHDYGRLYINYSRLIQPRAHGDMVWLRGSTFTDSGYGSECSLRGSIVGGKPDDVDNPKGICLFTEEF